MSCGCGTTTTAGTAGGCGCGGACGCGRRGAASAGAVGGGGFLRPRFFAGQLLTEDDLEALVTYTAAKSRLHNRYLVGAGVVGGLEVSCHPTKPGWVRVAAGYALDCCGEDIVVPCAVEVDVNELIAAMPRKASCDEPCPPDDTKRLGGRPCRTYTLVVSYAEEPAEILTAYPVDDEPCGSSSGSRCEVSLVREGFRIGLRCGSPDDERRWMLDDIVACWGRLCRGTPDVERERATDISVSPESATRSVLSSLRVAVDRMVPCRRRLAALAASDDHTVGDRQFVIDVRQAMIEALETTGLTDCTLLCDVTAVRVGDSPNEAAGRLVPLLQAMMVECVCRAVNPPLATCDDPAVVLATVCVDACEVIDICNSARHLVISGPALGHWLPLGSFHQLLEELCCGSAFSTAGEPARRIGQRLSAALGDQLLVDAGVAAARSFGLSTDEHLQRQIDELGRRLDEVREAARPAPGAPSGSRTSQRAGSRSGRASARPPAGEREPAPAEEETGGEEEGDG